MMRMTEEKITGTTSLVMDNTKKCVGEVSVWGDILTLDEAVEYLGGGCEAKAMLKHSMSLLHIGDNDYYVKQLIDNYVG